LRLQDWSRLSIRAGDQGKGWVSNICNWTLSLDNLVNCQKPHATIQTYVNPEPQVPYWHHSRQLSLIQGLKNWKHLSFFLSTVFLHVWSGSSRMQILLWFLLVFFSWQYPIITECPNMVQSICNID
jgi:hypothetical protein